MPDKARPDTDRLYNLLPVYYRQRDAEGGEHLRALLAVMSEQVEVLDQDISRLYDDWFIETCQDWVVPYIADLVGYRLAPEAGEPGDVTTVEGRRRNRTLIPRREVANTLRYRRRKGTLALLELLANDLAGWPARAVEFGRLLGVTASLNHPRPERGRVIDAHAGDALDLIDSPFDGLSHTVDVRRIGSRYRPGHHNLGNLGLFVFRLKSYSITRAEARCIEEGANAGDHCFTFSPLGNDRQLFCAGTPDPEPSRFSGELNLPIPIRRRAFTERPSGLDHGIASDAYYGEGKSIAIWLGKDARKPVPREKVIPAHLEGWRYRPPSGYVAVDPVLGRLCFRPGEAPPHVIVSYHYGFSDEIGGGEYERPEFLGGEDRLYVVSSDGGEVRGRLHQALEQWKHDKPRCAVVEITDSQTYNEDCLNIDLEKNQRLEIRASQGCRPIIRMLDSESGRAESISINGQNGGTCVFDGVFITGRSVRIRGDVRDVIFRHCTLVPGWGLHHDCRPRHAGDPSIQIRNSGVRLSIEHSILGGIQIEQPRRENEPTRIEISDSVVDASDPRSLAIWDEECLAAWATLTILRSTVIGQLQIHAVELAEDSIFTGLLTVARRQTGCVRFCYVPPDSRTPRRYHCQPDLAASHLSGEAKAAAESSVVPVFKSTSYGTSEYVQLSENCSSAIGGGASDRSEMGVFHDLFQPQRHAALLARLEEYVPASSQVGILFAT